MNKYKIVLKNKDGIEKVQYVKKLTFPEAAAVAYYTRSTSGMDFEILSIVKQ